MQQVADKPASDQQADFLPLNGTDYVEFYVGNAKQAAYYYRAAFGMQLDRLSRTGNRHARSLLLTSFSRARSDSCSRRRSIPTARSRNTSSCTATAFARSRSGGRRRSGLPGDHPARRTRCAGAGRLRRFARPGAGFSDRRLWRHHPRVHRAQELPRRVSAGISRRRGSGHDRASCRTQVHRPYGRQRRLGTDERLGRLLSRHHGLPALPALRRQGHQHRILRADVEGDVGRQRPGEVSDQ